MDKIEELQKLKQLLDDGLITQVEYDSLKAEIIGIKPVEEPKKETPVVPPVAPPTPPTPVEPKVVVAEEPIKEPVKEEPKKPEVMEAAAKSNKKVLIGVLIGVGVIGLVFLVKIVFFPPAPKDDSLVDEIEVIDEENEEAPIEMDATSSSTIPSSQGLTYTAANAIDGNLFTWWSPKQNPKGEEWLRITFDRTAYISSIKIHGGSHYPNYSYKEKHFGDLYYMNLRVKQARLEFSDGSYQVITLRDEDYIQEIMLDESVTTSYVKIIPISSYRQVGGWDDYCISEVDFTF
jgi:hypothetical protein